MRIEFANAEREGLDWPSGEVRIGSAADNALVLQGSGIAPYHLRLCRDARGIVMQVEPDAPRVYVNARPVRERALLRAGDVLGIGGVSLRLCEAGDLQGGTGPDLAVAALRAVAGPLSGRVAAVGERLDLGTGGRWPLALGDAADARLAVVREDGRLCLEAGSVPARHPVCVNGEVVARAWLRDGDQIGVGAHRFVLDAGRDGLVAHPRLERFLPHEAALPEDTAGPRGELWWLIFTAALLGLAIATLLLIRL